MGVTTIEDLPGHVLSRALRRLDGRSLAAASCATSGLRALAADPDTWRALCLAEWPSLARLDRRLLLLPPRRLFADASPFPSPDAAAIPDAAELPARLVSAVDVYCAGEPLLSRVVDTPASSPWFLGSPFRVEALERRKPPPDSTAAVLSPADLQLSWVVVDPSRGRAVNVSSRRPVSVDRHWYTGETLVRFATVLGGCKFEAVVSCAELGGCVTEVGLASEDADGAAVAGEGALRLLAAAMEAPRRGGAGEQAEAERRYRDFVRRKRGRKESKARREALVDLCCSAASAVVVLTILAAVALR